MDNTLYIDWQKFLYNYIEIIKQREAKGLYLFKNVVIKNHPLVNEPIKDNGTDYIIDKVGIHWWQGYYYLYILLNNKGSHGMRYIHKWQQIFTSEKTLHDYAMTITDINFIAFG